jgi:26S proteasome regulatory subunit N2
MHAHSCSSLFSYNDRETLYDEETFPARERSALLISKVYFHLGEMEEALQFALNAGRYFHLDESSQFVDTIVSKCIEKYVQNRRDGKEEEKLEEVVNAMFERCFEQGEYREALGIAIESRRKDMIRRSIESSPNVVELLSYCFQTSLSYEADIAFRHEVCSSSSSLSSHTRTLVCMVRSGRNPY